MKTVIIAGAILLATAVGCASDEDPTTLNEVTSSSFGGVGEPIEAPTETTSEPVVDTTNEPVDVAAETVPMPNVICMNLQAAQDLIQEAGVFLSRSDDATGQGRSQLVDSNWIVVDQTPAAGAPIGEADAVLGAVKYGEEGSAC